MPTNLLYRADCKYVLDDLYQEGVRVDLIYLDPPFNSSRIYNMIFNSHGINAQQKAFHDMWDFHDRTRKLLLDFEGYLEESEMPKQFQDFMTNWLKILEQGNSEDQKLLNYLMYMTERLIRMKKILKDTGSIYFHCDPNASHYIKIIMDGVFGRENFRSEIIWKRTNAHGSARRWGPIHDTILFYTISGDYVWNRTYQEYESDYLEKHYRSKDNYGKYQPISLTGPGTTEGNSGKPWRGINPTSSLRHWAIPTVLPDRFVSPDGYDDMSCQDKLEVLNSQDMIYWPEKGSTPRFKRYIELAVGNPIQDMVLDIQPISSNAVVDLGYPTQKPIALLDRIIKASCPNGGTVLDPFCGCGTTIEASHSNGTKWVGIDISGEAVELIVERLANSGVYQTDNYKIIEGNPETISEYNRMNPFEKQDWLIRRVHGFPNPRKTGDGGIDGEMQVHAGFYGEQDHFQKVIFSVKTGKQADPKHVRELGGTIKQHDASFGVLILDKDPSQKMEEAAEPPLPT